MVWLALMPKELLVAPGWNTRGLTMVMIDSDYRNFFCNNCVCHNKTVLTSNCPYSEYHRSQPATVGSLFLSLHHDCPCKECPYTEKSLYLQQHLPVAKVCHEGHTSILQPCLIASVCNGVVLQSCLDRDIGHQLFCAFVFYRISLYNIASVRRMYSVNCSRQV